MCRVRDYAEAVVSGTILAGRPVVLACERHLRDLKEAGKRGLEFRPELAERLFQFARCLNLPAEGAAEDKPFELEPSQAFILGSIFGWVHAATGLRRFRTAYIEQGKGSGKTPMSALVGLYGLTADGESGAEIYPAATTTQQAGISFRDAKRMAEASPSLRTRLDIGMYNIAYPRTGSFMRPVSSEHRGLDGKRVHMGLIDEIHEHRDSMVVDKIRAGTKARRQALIFEITNSGYDKTSVCWAHHDYSLRVLDGAVEDDSWFAYVCSLDPCAKHAKEGYRQPVEGCADCDQWDDEAVWIKANPTLDRVLPRQYLREQVREAKGMPSKEGIVKRLNFCLWTEQATRAIPMDRWAACAKPAEVFKDARLNSLPCYGGLDIGATRDFTAYVEVFPHDDSEQIEIPQDWSNPDGPKLTAWRRGYTLLPHFWLPSHPAKRDERMMGLIDSWRRQGFVKTTPGDVVDYDVVLEDIQRLAERRQLAKLAFDRGFQGSWMGTKLMATLGPLVHVFPQGILSMNAPFRELLELIIQGRLWHPNNPVLNWMAANTASEERGGLIKPSKDVSTEKIDGIAAATMAVGVAMLTEEVDSWYTPGCLLT